MLDKFITAINRMNHTGFIFILFLLGVATAVTGYLLVALFPHVDHDIEKGMAFLGATIVTGAMMAFRSGSSSSEFETDDKGQTTTRESIASGDPAPPAL